MAHFRRRAFGFEGGQIVTMDGETHDVGNWDLLIAHPPCTYLSNAGARHLWKNHQLQEDRVIKGILGRDLFMRFWWADIPKICVEKPDSEQGFCPSEIYTKHPAVPVWAPLHEEDLPLAKRAVPAGTNGRCGTNGDVVPFRIL